MTLLGPGTRPGTIDRSDLGTQIADSAMFLIVGIVLVTCRQPSQKEKINKLTSNRGALARRTRQIVGATALPVSCEYVCGTSGGIPSTQLRRITGRVFGGSTDLCCGRELALRGATRRTVRIANSIVPEFAGVGIAARRICAFTWIAVFPTLHDSVSAHLECDGLARGIRVQETASIYSVGL